MLERSFDVVEALRQLDLALEEIRRQVTDLAERVAALEKKRRRKKDDAQVR